MATSGAAETTSSYDKTWTIHASIIGLNMGNILFRGLELDQDNPDMVVVTGLTILAAALPFQAIFFLITLDMFQNYFLTLLVNIPNLCWIMFLKILNFLLVNTLV